MALWRSLADSGVDTSPASLFVAEKDTLVGAILGFPRGGRHAATIEAVGEFLIHFHAGGIPWVRIYNCFPSWQQQCGLLTKQWDRGAVLEEAKVFFTLLNPQGAGFSREALGGDGTWTIKEAQTIPNQFVVSKLYYKTGGYKFTVFEFRLTMELQPRVAICVLHRTSHRCCVRDLRRYIRQGWFPGGNQAILPMVPPVIPDHRVAGFMNGQHIDYTNLASSSGTSILGANQTDQMAVQHEEQYLAHSIAGFMNGSQLDYTTNPVPNNASSGYHPPSETETQMSIPSNSCPMNGMYDDMLRGTNMFGGQYSHPNAMSIQRDYCDTSFWNSNMQAITPIQDAMLDGLHSQEDETSTQDYYYNP